MTAYYLGSPSSSVLGSSLRPRRLHLTPEAAELIENKNSEFVACFFLLNGSCVLLKKTCTNQFLFFATRILKHMR